MNPSILETINEMYIQREYNNIHENEINNLKVLIGFDKNGKKIVAFLETINKLNVEVINKIFEYMEENKTKHVIIVYNGDPTPAVNNTIAQTVNLDITVELFPSIDLLFNITKHYLVPKHQKISKEELKELKDKIELKNLPKISKNDAVAKFFNFNKGDVIKIFRKNGEIAYRYVIG